MLPLSWPGTRPEFLVFRALEGLGLKEGEDFQYQSSQQGGRQERGGAVLDFFLPALSLGLNVASTYWHYGRPERALNDRAQRESLEYQVFPVLVIRFSTNGNSISDSVTIQTSINVKSILPSQ